MAGKSSERALLEPQAKRLYAEGHSQSAIAERLGVSVATVSRWYADAGRPDCSNEWDEKRATYRSYGERLDGLFDRELEAAEGSVPGSLTSVSMDALQKLGQLALRYRELESRTGQVEIDRPKLFLEHLEFMAKWFRENAPEGLKVLARNFDPLIIAFKAEHEKSA